MAITIQNTPSNNVSVTDEILFVVYEATKANDPVTYPDYRYVCDIYVDDVFVARQIARPDPTYKMGKFNVATILRNYVTYSLKANYASAYDDYTAKVSYKLKFGEEYDGTLYTNLTVDSDSRGAFKSYATRPFVNSEMMPAVDNKFITNMPQTVYGYKTDKWFLLSFYDNASGFAGFSYQFYNGSSTVGAAGAVSGAGYSADTIRQADFGFVKLATALSLSQSEQDSITHLVVQAGLSARIVMYQCSKHTPITLAWLNPYGAYDSYSFGLVSKKSQELTRKEFQQLSYRLNVSGEVSYHENGVFYGSKRGYAGNVKTTLKMTSHLLTDAEYAWLAEMFASTDVYMYDTTLDKFFPVSVQETNYEVRTYKNSRLVPLEFNINFSDEYNTQFL